MIQSSTAEAPATEKATAMQIDTVVKGTIEVQPEHVVRFVSPLIGFDHLQDFVFLQTQDGPLCWLQSTQEKEAAFCVLSVFDTPLDPDIAIGPQDLAAIGANNVEEVSVYTLVVLDEHPDQIRTNLRAPILVCNTTNQATQMVLDDPKLPVQFYLRELLTGPGSR